MASMRLHATTTFTWRRISRGTRTLCTTHSSLSFPFPFSISMFLFSSPTSCPLNELRISARSGRIGSPIHDVTDLVRDCPETRNSHGAPPPWTAQRSEGQIILPVDNLMREAQCSWQVETTPATFLWELSLSLKNPRQALLLECIPFAAHLNRQASAGLSLT